MTLRPLSIPAQWRIFTGLAAVALVAAVLLAGWLARRDAEAAVRRQSDATAALHTAVLRSELERQQAVPSILARDPDLLGLLATRAPDSVDRVNRKLEALTQEIRSAAIYVLDARGLTLAASNWREPTSFVGSDYGFRPYYAEAMATGRSAFFALGTVSGRPGLYLARRIDTEAGAPAGVIVAKVEFDALEAQWRAAGDPTYVTDQDGVVLITTRPDWRFHTTRPLTDARRREIATDQTAGGPLIDLPFKAPSEGMVRIARDLQPGLYAHATDNSGGLNWTVHILTPADPTIRRATGAAQGLAVLSVILLAGAAGLFLRRRHRAARREIEVEEARADLERQVDARTGELKAANQNLRREAEERRRLQRVRETLQDDLVQANKLATLGQIAAGVAHEINQPLAAIRTHADSAGLHLQRGDPESTTRSLAQISDLTDRAGRITDELRAFSRKTTSATVAVDVDAAVDGALMLLGARLRERGVTLTRPEPAGLLVMAERNRLEQVLLNLIQNAVEAVEGVDQPAVALTIDAADDSVILRVIDNGAGLSPAIRDRLFTPFATDKTRGTGLGLVISRDIVSGFGGELMHEPSASGAVFRLTLKRATS